VSEPHRLVNRSRHWWENSSLALAYNTKSGNRTKVQYGGVVLWAIGQTTHRVKDRGQDPTGLGRGTWINLKGRNNRWLRIYTVYRPAIPTGGPFTVCAQHRNVLSQINDEWCPREAFFEDLCADITAAKQKGDLIIVLLDGNESMVEGRVYQTLRACCLKEAITAKHGGEF
jgi:hypothetical protein